MHAYCSVSAVVRPFPSGNVVPTGLTAFDIPGKFGCSCASEELGHGYGPQGCSANGWVVRIVYAGTMGLSADEQDNLLQLLGPITCIHGSADGCDHIHFTQHGSDLGVNVLFTRNTAGKQAAEAAAEKFNSAHQTARRNGIYPSAVDPAVGARVYAWEAGTTASPLAVLPSGLELQSVHFEPACHGAETGCWVLDVTFTTGSSDVQLETFNTFLLPYAVGSDTLSYDYDYSDHGILDTFIPANFPCRVSDYVAANGDVSSLPAAATGCCFGVAFDENVTTIGGDGSGAGLLGKYRPTAAFAAYAASVYPDLCPGGIESPSFDDDSGSGTTAKPEDRFPDGSRAGGHHADTFVAAGQSFVGMPDSPGVTRTKVLDSFLGIFTATIKLDERELRTRAGLLRGTVGVEHTVDFFLGFASFKPADTTWILDSSLTQVAIHVEKTDFFSVSTSGVNDYTFLEYVNLRLVAVYQEDRDFSGVAESADRLVRTNSTSAAHYVQVTFTLGAKFGVNTNSGLIPLSSVRAGKGAFFATTNLHSKCVEYTAAPDNEFDSWDTIARFNNTLTQECGPAAAMCSSPSSILDSFVAFNIPLGIDFLGTASNSLSSNVFVDLVISAVDTQAQGQPTNPNSGEAPWQVKTTLSASIPVVEGGINIFCDGITAKTDLKDVANVDVVVGSAASMAELSRLRIVTDIAGTQLNPQGAVTIDSDSIEAGLLTLVIKGNASYFESGAASTRGVSLELEDVVTLHLMETDGATADGDGSQGTQAAVKSLLAEPPADNSNIDGLDTDGYGLNGAFYFTVDRASQRAHLQPTERLRSLCFLNPPRPQETNAVVMETCVMRQDVRFRDYPWRMSAVSTAMEVNPMASDGETGLPTTSTESRFFTSLLGESQYARQLGADYSRALDERYRLNGRFRRAFFINPGYEWSPSSTGGASLFQLSQKVFLFALITLDERLASSPGKSIFDSELFAGAAEDVNSDGAAEAVANLPRVPGGRRRTLLTVDPSTGAGSTLSAAELAFPVSRTSAIAAAYGARGEQVGTFAVRMSLTTVEACMNRHQLQVLLQERLNEYVERAATAMQTVQLYSLSISGADCTSRRASASQAAPTAQVGMIVVFTAGARASFDLSAFGGMQGIAEINAVSVPRDVSITEAGPQTRPMPTQWPDEDVSTTSAPNFAVAAGAGAGGLFVLASACAVWRFRQRSLCTAHEQLHRSASVDEKFAQLKMDLDAVHLSADLMTSTQRESDSRSQESLAHIVI